MQASHPGWRLRGRDSELEALDGVLRTVRDGRSAVLVLRGDAGIGKTAVLDYLVEQASGCRIARATGAEAEMELAFAGLHQLCGPMLDRGELLPGPQRDALATVFGRSAGPAPDRFLVAVAVLSLLSEVAAEVPLVCVVDDAQWLDRASAQCLAFVARRVLAERLALVFAVREPSVERELSGLPELFVRGLGEADAEALLQSAIVGRLDVQVRDRILAEARGNPLALLELHTAVNTVELAGGFGVRDARPLATRIEDRFADRAKSLPTDAQLLLLIAAAEPVGDPALLWSAAALLGVDADAAAAAEATGLIEFGARVRFRHPLVRSALYRTALMVERQRVHRALAEAKDVALDPDRRAWHRAQAAPGPDENVAAELERSAHRAQTRGGAAAAGAFLGRAAELTPDATRRGSRALAAAEAELQAGAFAAALALLKTAEAGPLEELQHARIDLLRGRLAFLLDRGREAPGLLLKAAQRLQPLEVDFARETFLEALTAAMYAGRLATGCSPTQVGEAVIAVGQECLPPRPADLLLDGLALLTTAGRGAAVPKLKRAVAAFGEDTVEAEDMLLWLWIAPAAQIVWDHEGWDLLSQRQVQLARETGALGPLAFALSQLATLHASRVISPRLLP
jgi:AAA ATPase domain